MIFYINIPIGIVAFIMTFTFGQPEVHRATKVGLDWAGLGLMAIGLASLQYVLERGEYDEWFDSSTITILTVVAVVALAIFVWKMIRDPHPLVNLKVFKHSSFTIGSILGVIRRLRALRNGTHHTAVLPNDFELYGI